MGNRRTFRDAGHEYDGVRKGLPEAVHKTLFETRDIESARQWLEDGTVPDGGDTPEAGTKRATPGLHLINSFGVAKNGSRWVEMRRRRYEKVDQLRGKEWDNTFHGYVFRGEHVRGQLRTTGRGSSRRYHVWWTQSADGKVIEDTIELFHYERPSPLYEVEPESPPRTKIALNQEQLAIVKLLTAT